MAAVPNIPLNDGNTIPQLGFGVFQIEPADTEQAVRTALEVGYRHIDTARDVRQREGGRRGHRASGIPRDEIFVTSKLNNGFHRPDDARRAFDETLRDLRPGPGRPVPDPLAAADPLRRRLRVDLAGAGGVRQGRPGPLHRGVQLPGRAPAAAGRGDRDGARGEPDRGAPLPDATTRCASYGAEHGIRTEAWSPIAQGGVLDDPVITEIARADGTHPGPGGAALARPARRHRLPQVGDPRAGCGRTSSSSTSS